MSRLPDIRIDTGGVRDKVLDGVSKGLNKTAERAVSLMRATSAFNDDSEAAERRGYKMLRTTFRSGEAGNNPRGAFVYSGWPGYWIETGTEKMEPRPFIRPSVEQAAKGIEADVGNCV